MRLSTIGFGSLYRRAKKRENVGSHCQLGFSPTQQQQRMIANEIRCVFENKPLYCTAHNGDEIGILDARFVMEQLPLASSEEEECWFDDDEEMPVIRVVHRENESTLAFRLDILDMEREGCDIFLKMRFYIDSKCFLSKPRPDMTCRAFLDLNAQRIWVDGDDGFGMWICVRSG